MISMYIHTCIFCFYVSNHPSSIYLLSSLSSPSSYLLSSDSACLLLSLYHPSPQHPFIISPSISVSVSPVPPTCLPNLSVDLTTSLLSAVPPGTSWSGRRLLSTPRHTSEALGPCPVSGPLSSCQAFGSMGSSMVWQCGPAHRRPSVWLSWGCDVVSASVLQRM